MNCFMHGCTSGERLHARARHGAIPRIAPGLLSLYSCRAWEPCACSRTVDAAYIAGIVDGEGTITSSRLHSNERRRIVVSIPNNERELLEYVQRSGLAAEVDEPCASPFLVTTAAAGLSQNKSPPPSGGLLLACVGLRGNIAAGETECRKRDAQERQSAGQRHLCSSQ